MNIRSQSAIEFMIILGAVLFVFLTFLLSLQIQRGEQAKESRNQQIKEIALIIQSEIRLATSASDGYQRAFQLPPTALNADYNASIETTLVYVRTLDGKYAIALPVTNVSGQPQKGTNTIKKTNGSIFLNT